MARSANQDIYEKFRFRVTVFSLDPNGLFNVGFSSDSEISAGFSEVVIPQANIKERIYRENIDPNRYIKAAGLATYEPVVLRRGKVGDNRELYRWYTTVNNDAASLSPLTSLISNQNAIHISDPNYRKEVAIELLSRDGSVKRAWLLFNAWPTTYKGGNDLNSSSEEKLIEEMTLSYESFVELNENTVDELNGETERAAVIQAVSGIVSGLVG